MYATAASGETVRADYAGTVPFQSEAARIVAAETGPKCGECGKPYKLAGRPDGCSCPRYVGRRDNLSSPKSMQLRQTVAMERLSQLLEVYLTAQGVDVPLTVPSPTPAETQLGVAIDAIRARHEAAGKAV